ncbi:aminoglycoside phosphotransferase family protein [Puniceibacterium sediminis]|uniref:Streptomycin 6-kinase n=1 Tax=Puniceibacterium sediminis TaxID=1608407 RepID=A0A238W8R2_9RHOB|nr:aminoglycoside phosphotransferase family protein [Puniceibacterium sediminis]SNR42781.1 Streptomycin 6-kinase [Puniceibacterium sediminis]
MDEFLETRLERWSLRDPKMIQHNAAVSIFKVTRPLGDLAALKIYHRGHAGNETGAAPYLVSMAGRGVAKVLAVEPDALLTEWLHGPDLSDLTHMTLQAADQALVGLARNLLADPVPQIFLPTLSNWIADARRMLLSFEPTDARTCLFSVLRHSQTALVDYGKQQPLHGDLHHGNIIVTSNGAMAFDAKGVWGPKPYELANALRHPAKSAPVSGTALANRLAFVATALDIAPSDLAYWTAVKTALSVIWRGEVTSSASRRDLDRLRACLALCAQ